MGTHVGPVPGVDGVGQVVERMGAADVDLRPRDGESPKRGGVGVRRGEHHPACPGGQGEPAELRGDTVFAAAHGGDRPELLVGPRIFVHTQADPDAGRSGRGQGEVVVLAHEREVLAVNGLELPMLGQCALVSSCGHAAALGNHQRLTVGNVDNFVVGSAQRNAGSQEREHPGDENDPAARGGSEGEHASGQFASRVRAGQPI